MDAGDVKEITDSEKTGAGTVCAECGQSLHVIPLDRPPQLDELATSDIYWLPKGADGVSESCILSGTHDGPAWWFCPTTGWFVVRGMFRAQVQRL